MDKKAQWSMVSALWVLVLGLLLLGWMALRGRHGGGAANPFMTGPGHYICPVSRQEVTVAPDTAHVVYKDVPYYFCGRRDERGRDHKTLFLMDPEYYLTGRSSYPNGAPGLAQSPAPGAAPAAPAAPTPDPQTTGLP